MSRRGKFPDGPSAPGGESGAGGMMDLFAHRREELLAERGPLAARMRPRTLEEFVGQDHILGPGRLLRRAIQADQLSSLIFYGPPGCGKTTLAQIIAHTTQAHFTALNAVLAGVADLRAAVKDALERLEQQGQRTILFVDEVHRFNKAQQDALLPHVENGTVILIGATTENPYFEVNKTILSRSRIFALQALEDSDIEALLRRALADSARGYGARRVSPEPDALAHLARVANGDARAALNALELAVETTPPGPDGVVRVDLAVAEESIQRRAVLYDKEGDAHFDTISAFIKSLRGSDPDAALYWMARMLYAGEDPRFILRRMLIFAAEDVGLADPQALAVTEAAARAFDYVGLPEGRFHLSEACLYLASAPKSNSSMAFFEALAAVEAERSGEVPDHLKDANRDAEGLGHGMGYLYPHAYRDHWVAQQYLPDHLRGRQFYDPGEIGYERTLRERVIRLREAQQAAWLEPSPPLPGQAPPEGPLAESAGVSPGTGQAAWRQRSTLGEHLEAVRQRLFELAEVKRQHLVLDAHAETGLLTWEALRLASDVWVLAESPRAAERLRQQAARFAESHADLPAPVVLAGEIERLPALIEAEGQGPVRFDRVLARGALGRHADKAARVAALAGLLLPGGRLVLAEPVLACSERILAALDWSGLDPALAKRAVAAEAAIYSDPHDPMVNWDEPDLATWCEAAGLWPRRRELLRRRVDLALGPEEIARWFDARLPGGGRLGRQLGEEAPAVRRFLEQRLTARSLPRLLAVAIVAAERPAVKMGGPKRKSKSAEGER
jgi:putative ATPase